MTSQHTTADCRECAARRRMLDSATPELLRRRYPPTGDRDLWVRYGPAGPPHTAVESEAAA